MVRRLCIAVAGLLFTASCAAGQHAQTAEVRPAIDATRGVAGSMLLEGVAIHAPSGPSYPARGNAQVAVTLVNNGNSADTLVDVSGPAFAGWGIVDNAQA